MTPEDIREVARQAASNAVKEAIREEIHDIFRMLGVDTNDQRSLNLLRADLMYARELRKLNETLKKRFWFVVVGVAVLAAVSAFWEGIKVKMGW